MISNAPTDYLEYDRAGPLGGVPVVLLHAGIADRRMWDPQWSALTADHDVIRLDLRGFGDSTTRPDGLLSHVDDVLGSLVRLGVGRCQLVAASLGAGIAVEVALTRPELVASLLLSAPGGSLIVEFTPDLRAFVDAERAALGAGDLDAAVQANLDWWVAGPQRDLADVDSGVTESVRQMQRRAFELTADWDDVDEVELDPPALERLGEIAAPTLVLVGGLDLEAIRDTAERLTAGLRRVRRVDWADVAHLPSMERPGDFLALVRDWLNEGDAPLSARWSAARRARSAEAC